MKFPYGISDFYQLITEDYFYVDRTGRIKLLEESGKQLLFLRPRRFGKSLWLSTLENYYDVARTDQFESLFGRLAIGQNPTPLHNQYFVLKWDFSTVDPQGNVEEIKQALYDHINTAIENFGQHYQNFLAEDIKINPTNAITSFQALSGIIRQTPYRLYLLIDEYDNFANEVMMAGRSGDKRYRELLYGEGTLKTVFKAVKAAGAGMGLDRVFITGVSPVVLSDVTSGYNVAQNIYLKPQFNDLCGFGEAEIEETLDKIGQSCDFPPEKVAEALAMMRSFYNGYCFAPGEERLIYNPTLALYFMEDFQARCRYPDEMLDSNLAMDRGKLIYISHIPGGEQLLLDALDEPSPLTIPRLADRFGVEDMLTGPKDKIFMASLLYYFGVLTLAGQTAFREIRLRVPNQVVRGLYLERVREILLPEPASQEERHLAAKTLYGQGDIQPVCDFIENHYFRIFDNRDYRWSNELTIKTLFLTILYNDLLYFIESEVELERSYADLALIRRPDLWQQPFFDILLEFKYIKLSEKQGLTRPAVEKLSAVELKALPPVQKKLAEARPKLEQYSRALSERYGETLRLRRFAIVSLGFERLVWDEVANYSLGIK